MESGLNDAIVFYKTSYCTVHIFSVHIFCYHGYHTPLLNSMTGFISHPSHFLSCSGMYMTQPT